MPSRLRVAQARAFLALLCASFSLHAGQTWYVSTTGSDFNSGTDPAAPLQHIQTAIDGAVYGDTVNIEAGVYREQVFISSDWAEAAGIGSTTNMLTVQAWDTNADGIIETNEMPTINGFQEVTNWTALSDTKLWAALTGGAPYQPNVIFWTHWSTNDTVVEPLELVMESDTNVMQQTSWPQFDACNHPLAMPTNMMSGSFQYDYTNHILYVWRGDGNAPGPAFPIQAAWVDPSLPYWGDNGPFASQADYIILRGIRFRNCNASADSTHTYTASTVSLQHGSRMEQCDVQWSAFQGLGLISGNVITNCIISNNGEPGITILSTNNRVVGCTFSNNDCRHYTGSCMSIGAVHFRLNATANVIAGNTFLFNVMDAIHCDTSVADPSNPCVIEGNFVLATNYPDGQLGGGIDLELASGCLLANNIIVSAGGTGIFLSDAQSNCVVNNTVSVWGDPNDYPPQALVVNATASRDNNHQYDQAFSVIANNIFVSHCNGALVATAIDSSNAAATVSGAICHDNVYAHNLLWNYLTSTNTNCFPIQLNLSAPPYAVPIVMTNASAWARLLSGTDTPCQNTGNVLADPLFYNPANSTNPFAPSYYLLSSNSPARNVAGAATYGLTNDFLANPRGFYPDAGAFQYGLLFCDDFARTAWAPWQVESGTWSLSGGSLQGSSGTGSFGSILLTNAWSNYLVIASLQWSSAGAYGGGLAACVNPLTGARYAAWVYPEGSPVGGGQAKLALLKFQDWTDYSYLGVSGQPIAQAGLPSVGTSWHTLELACQGSQLTVYFDGTQVLNATDAEAAPYASGGIGVDLYTAATAFTLSVSNAQAEAFSPKPIVAGQPSAPAAPSAVTTVAFQKP